MKKKLLLFFTFFCIIGLHQNIKGQTLVAGDIAFIGYNTDDPDGFSFIALKALPAGEKVYFTEEGWNGTAWGAPTESHLEWIIPSGISCGTIVSVSETGTNTFTVTVSAGIISTITLVYPTSSPNFQLSAGDQVFAYQSPGGTVRPSNPTFIAGIHGDYNSANIDGTTKWNASMTTGVGTDSVLPSALTNGVNAISLFPNGPVEYNNAIYNATLTGNPSILRSAINTYTNWISNDGSAYAITPDSYVVSNITCTSLPTVATTTPATNIGALTATLGGTNTDGGATILNRGVLWSLTPDPVIGPGATNVSTSTGTGVFTVSATSLPSATTIYYRAYATNSEGTAYGNTASFMTNASLSAVQSQTNACNGSNNGTATVTPSGGKTPYTYTWSNSTTTSTATNLAPNNYSVLITDGEGTSISRNFSITQNSIISGTTIISNVSCNGGNNGSIDLTPSGGSGSYTYNWGGGITTQDRISLAAGTYSVTITDSNNCSQIISNIVVGQPAAPLSAITGGGKTDVSCFGGSNGTATVAPTGGTSTYTYSWNTTPVQTTATAIGLSVGTYTVTVTDANSCQTTRSFTINQPTAGLSAATGGGKTDVSCRGGNNGTATVAPTGGTPNYTYSWDTTPVQTTATAVGLITGTYTVTVTDANGCQATRSFTINQPAAALSAATGGGKTDVSCNGGNNGTATVAPTGGTPTYTYSWNTTPIQTTAMATGLAVGTYTVTVTDANACQTTRSFTINQPATSLSVSPAGQTDILCNGSATGSATVTATGGTPGYTYSWSPSGGTAETATGLTAGTYTVTVTDANSCQATQSFTITEPGALVASQAAQTNIACRDGLTGSATVNATGGAGGYTYSWSPSGGTAATASGLAAGTYTVTVTDANNCQATQAFTIVQPTTALTTTAGTINNTSCYTGGNGTATVIASGGTPSYSYSWNTTPIQTTATASGLSAGTYRVTVTDANGCTANRDFTISQPPALSITPSQTNVSCNGGTNGTATASVSGGTGAGTYTYSWSPTGGNAASATGLQSGTYTVTVTDANNCQIAQSYTIDQPAALTATQSQTEVLCNGSATGTATVVASGGSPNYSYSWSPSGGTAATATGLAANTYTCTITDNNGCFITKTFTISQPAAPLSATTSQINATCSTGGQASVSPSGGTPSYSYLWSSGGETTPFITGKAAGNYICIITDANGCTLTKNFTISTTNTLVASAAQTNVLCNGSSTGSASVIPSGAPGPFTYVWAPYGGNTETAVNLSAGNYSVTITSSNGCSIIKTFTITEPSAINITPSQTNVTCNTGSNGSASVTVTGGTGTYTYAWSPSGGSAATATGLSAGTYTVTVTDANLCTKTQSFTITEPDALTPSVSQTDVSCNGGSNGSATVSVTGGTGTYSYQWSPSGETNATASGLSAGTYTVLIKDINLCETTASVTIVEPALLTATIDKTDVLCNQANDGTATVTASGGTIPYTYIWSPSGGTNATASGLSPGNYTVTITDGNGCFTTQSTIISEPTILSITDSHTNVTCNNGNNGTASVIATGGTGNYTYSWSPSGGTSATATGLSAGTYIVTITDDNSCTVLRSITITEPDALVATISQTDVSCYTDSNGSATVTVTGGTGAYTYLWAPIGGTAATATGLPAGTYTVTINDDNFCEITKTVIITEPNELTATITKIDVQCNQANNATATVTPTGGTAPYTYNWSPSGGTNATASNLSPNTYTITVTDANGCFATETVTINEPNVLAVTESHTNVTCNNENDGTASVNITGGTGNYSYAWTPSGGTNATATGLSAGTYTVTITDDNSCSVTKTITITEPEPLTAIPTIVNVSCFNGANGSASITAAGGTAPYSYIWTHNSQATASISDLSAGIYNVIVTDSNSCALSLSVEITQPTNPVTLNTASVSGNTLSGTVSSNGINTDNGACLTEVGFVYATHTLPVVTDNKISVSATLGTFTTSLSGLNGNSTYYVRTYAINNNGYIHYGNEVSFTTEKYTLTIAVDSGNSKIYGTSDPKFNYTASGFANGDTNAIITGQLSRDPGENVGKYDIKLGTLNAGGAYTIVFTGAEFEITKADQIITWNQNLEFGCDDSNNVTLTAVSNSGLPVSYTIANPVIGTIAGTMLTTTNSGSTTITAIQNGDQNYNAATAVVQSIEISQSGLVTQQWADAIFFDNKTNNFVAWQWYKDGNAISGATRQYYSENQPLNGTYYVIATDKDGNSIKSCPIETVGTAFTKSLKIHPNPVKPLSEFTLQCDFSESQLNGAEITIFDITGKLVQTISNVKTTNLVSAPSQTAIYVVVLSLSNGQKKTINLLVK